MLISSHLLAELAQLIDDVVIIANGKVRRETTLAELAGEEGVRLRVRGRDPVRLWRAFEEAGGKVTAEDQTLEVYGLSPEDAGEIAFTAGVPLYELSADAPSLEQVFLELAAA